MIRKCEVKNCDNLAGTSFKLFGWELRLCRECNSLAVDLAMKADQAFMELRHRYIRRAIHLKEEV